MSGPGQPSILKGISPTFSGILNKQIAKIMDCIDAMMPLEAYSAMQTLIDALQVTDRDKLTKEYLEKIEVEIREATSQGGLDLTQERKKRSQSAEAVCYKHNRELFRAIMATLHAGGYLVMHIRPLSKRPGKIRIKP